MTATATRRRTLAATFGIDPHGPLWVRELSLDRISAGCRQCGCTEVFLDPAEVRKFLAGHRAGAELVKAVSGT